MWELWMLGRVGTRLFDAFFRAARKTGMLGEAEILGKSDLIYPPLGNPQIPLHSCKCTLLAWAGGNVAGFLMHSSELQGRQGCLGSQSSPSSGESDPQIPLHSCKCTSMMITYELFLLDF